MNASTGMPKTYIVTFVYGDKLNLEALHQYLFDSADVIAFWNYIPLVYCIKSHLSADALQTKLRVFFPGNWYLIAEVNSTNIDGVLPKAAWDWFYLDHHEKNRPPLPPANALARPPHAGFGSAAADLGLLGAFGLLPPDKKS